MNSIKIATLNIAGISDPTKRSALKLFLTDAKIDVACLQEVSFNSCPLLENDFKLIANTGPKKRGTAVLLRKDFHVHNVYFEPEGRLTSVDIGHVTFISIYAPSGIQSRQEREDFFKETVPAYLASCKNPAILMGDFNCIEKESDKKMHQQVSENRSAVSKALVNMVSAFALIDLWRKLKPNDPGYTFHCSSSSSRLDRIYCEKNILERFSIIETGNFVTGDHQSVTVNFLPDTMLNRRSENRGVWKLNAAILSEESYVEEIKKVIEKSAKNPMRKQDVSLWWDNNFKTDVKYATILYCKKRAFIQRETRRFFQSSLQEIINSEKIDWPAYRDLRREIRNWERNTLDGFRVRSRVPEDITCEKASVFHVKRLWENFNKNTISKLECVSAAENALLTDGEDINKEIVTHFEKIFKNQASSDNSSANFFLDCVKNVYTPRRELTDPITCSELKTALALCKKNKSPGLDGLPCEFYQALWDVI